MGDRQPGSPWGHDILMEGRGKNELMGTMVPSLAQNAMSKEARDLSS